MAIDVGRDCLLLLQFKPCILKAMKSNTHFKNLLKRKNLTQQQFADLVEQAWIDVSDRKLSRQAVSLWATGRENPSFSPPEILVVIEVLGCTLAELAIAFRDRRKKSKKGLTSASPVLHNEITQNSAPPRAPTS